MLLHPPQGELDLGLPHYSTFALFDRVIAAVSTNGAVPTVEEAWRFVEALERGPIHQLGDGTRSTYATVWRDFARYSEAQGVTGTDEVDRGLIERFVHAPTRSSARPAIATQRNRIAAIRCLYRTLRLVLPSVGDPTIDVRLDARTAGSVRPLTAPELERCHHVVDAVVMADRHLVIVALAESGATTGEIGYVRAGDLGSDHVALPGDRKSPSRLVTLTPWGVGAVARWKSAVQPEPDDLVAVPGAKTYDSRRTSVTHVLREVLVRAGLGDRHDLEPRSFLAAAAARTFGETGRIDVAARTIGFTSLDRTADLIGFDWTAQ